MEVALSPCVIGASWPRIILIEVGIYGRWNSFLELLMDDFC